MNIDFSILAFIQEHLSSSFGDAFFPIITRLGDAGMVWILMCFSLLLFKKTRKAGIVMAIALVFDLILCNVILKPLVARIRPYDIKEGITLLVAKPKDYSFPSGHTAASFTAVTALFLSKEKKLWIPSLVLACLIAFSRLYLQVHYPTDVLGGILVGIICGTAGYFTPKAISHIRRDRT